MYIVHTAAKKTKIYKVFGYDMYIKYLCMCPTAGAPTTITQVTADVSGKRWASLTWRRQFWRGFYHSVNYSAELGETGLCQPTAR